MSRCNRGGLASHGLSALLHPLSSATAVLGPLITATRNVCLELAGGQLKDGGVALAAREPLPLNRTTLPPPSSPPAMLPCTEDSCGELS